MQQNGRCSFIFTTILVHTNPYNLQQKFVPLLQSVFTSLFHPYLLTKSSLQIPLTLSSSISQQFSPPYFRVKPSQQTSPKIFSLRHPCSQFRLPQGTRELGSIVRTNTNLISPFFLKVWTMISGLTTTNSLYPAVSEKWCIAGSSLWWRCLQYGRPSNAPSLFVRA